MKNNRAVITTLYMNFLIYFETFATHFFLGIYRITIVANFFLMLSKIVILTIGGYLFILFYKNQAFLTRR